jgi:hypothetical protein
MGRFRTKSIEVEQLFVPQNSQVTEIRFCEHLYTYMYWCDVTLSHVYNPLRYDSTYVIILHHLYDNIVNYASYFNKVKSTH